MQSAGDNFAGVRRRAAASPSELRYHAALAVTAIILVLPLFAGTYLPLVDYPNHLARAYVLAHWESVPVFRETFVPVLEPIPNVAIDVLLVLFQQFVGVVEAGRLFLVLSVLVFLLGCHLLGRAVSQDTPWMAIPAGALFYSSPLLYGFVNYVFGVALFLVAFAVWLRWRARWTPLRLLGVSLLALAAYFSHLTAYAFLWLSVMVLTAEGLIRGSLRPKAAIVDILPLVPPALAFLAFMGGTGETGEIIWNTPLGKAIGLFAVVRTYEVKLDLVLAVLLAGAFLLLLLLPSVRARLDRRLLLPAGVFLVLFLASPKVLLTSSGADARFVVPAAVMIFLAFPIRLTHPRQRAAFLVVCGIMGLRLAAIAGEWHASSARAAQAVRLFDRLPVGAAVYPVFTAPGGADAEKRARGWEHLVHYATIRRHAYVPTLFAKRGQQPLVFRDPPAKPTQRARLAAGAAAEQGYGYLWTFGRPITAPDSSSPEARLIGQSAGFALYKINQAPGRAGQRRPAGN